jgi:hypothetical protein
MRLTKDVIAKILEMNEGFTQTTFYSARNFKETRDYLIQGGKLFIRSIGKTSWADSRFDDLVVADIDQTRRFIRCFINLLKTDGLS